MSRLLVPYELEDGLLLVGDEAWRPDEIEEAVATCIVCGLRFVVFTDLDTPVVSPRRKCCSDECRLEQKRRLSRSGRWASRRDAA